MVAPAQPTDTSMLFQFHKGSIRMIRISRNSLTDINFNSIKVQLEYHLQDD